MIPAMLMIVESVTQMVVLILGVQMEEVALIQIMTLQETTVVGGDKSNRF